VDPPFSNISKIEKYEKYIENINNSDLSYGFCFHFYRFSPLRLVFYKKYHDAHEIFLYFIILWTNKFPPKKRKFHFKAPKGFVKLFP
jgi:hypothetical protein